MAKKYKTVVSTFIFYIGKKCLVKKIVGISVCKAAICRVFNKREKNVFNHTNV